MIRLGWSKKDKTLNPINKYQFIDIHYHASPDLYDRRYHAIEAGTLYDSLNGAVVLKSHLGSTSVQATLANQLGLPVYPSVVLNAIAGGIHYKVITRALSEYQPTDAVKMIVHFPTITGRQFPSKLSRTLSQSSLSQYTQQGETLFNDSFKLRKEVSDILKFSRDHPIILSTGHASKEEIYCLIDACIQYNVPALLLNQPAHPLTNIHADELIQLSKNELIWTEQTALTYLLGHQDKKEFATVLTSIPRVIYSSDLGQTNQMDIGAWLDFSTHFFSEIGLSDQRQKELMQSNAAKLLS